MENIKLKIKSAGKMVIIPIIILLVLVATFIYNGAQRENESVMTIGDNTYVLASGSVENNTTLISSEVVGTVTELSVKEGDHVKKGDIIARLDNSNLENQVQLAESNLQVAEETFAAIDNNISILSVQNNDRIKQASVSLDFLKSHMDKSKMLLENGAIPQVALDEAELNYNVALSQYESTISNGNTQSAQLAGQLEVAKSQVAQAKTRLEQARKDLEKSVITAPSDGVINSIYTDIGEFTSTGKPLVELYDPGNVEIRVYVSESNIGFVKVGQEVDIFADHNESKPFKGRVVRVNNVAEFTPKNIQTKEERVNTVFEVKLKVEDAGGELKPGMPADVNIKID